jgi:hypothetical protein
VGEFIQEVVRFDAYSAILPVLPGFETEALQHPECRFVEFRTRLDAPRTEGPPKGILLSCQPIRALGCFTLVGSLQRYEYLTLPARMEATDVIRNTTTEIPSVSLELDVLRQDRECSAVVEGDGDCVTPCVISHMAKPQSTA